MKKMRKTSRKVSRKASRKVVRKASRKSRKSSRRRRCWSGGAAPVDDTSMNSPSKLSSAQGLDYAKLHEGQHGGAWGLSNAAGAGDNYMLEASNSAVGRPGQTGGAAVSLASAAPPGYTGMLDDSLRATARIGVLDQSLGQIQGMSDQSGGGRKRKNMSRKRKNMSRKRKSMNRKRKSMNRKRKSMNRRRKMKGGAALSPLSQAQDFGAPGMLLSPNQQAQALSGMNPEWKLASDPGAFKPAGM